MAVATTSLWASCFVLAYTSTLLNRNLGPAKRFWIYAAICTRGVLAGEQMSA